MELDELIAAEQRNDELVRQAREGAAAIVAAARQSADRSEAELTLGIDRLIQEGEAAIEDEHKRRATDIRNRAEADARRYDAVTDEQIAGMVPLLMDCLLADGPAP